MNDRFTELIARKLAGETTAEELQELEQYLRNHPQDQYFSELLYSYWNAQKQTDDTIDDGHFNEILKLAGEQIADAVDDSRLFEMDLRDIKKRRTLRLFKRAAVAAAFIGISFYGVYLYFDQKKQNTELASVNKEVVVKRGSKSHFLLPDGTQIWLNADSKLLYNQKFNGTTREVELEGEAYFDVVKDKTRPFIIHTKAMDIKVLGTVFNIKAYAEDKTTEASLIRGSIEASFKDRPDEKIILKPQEKIVFTNDGRIAGEQKINTTDKNIDVPDAPIITVTKIKYELNKKDSLLAETGWMKNTLVFRSEPFEDLALRLERWYNVKIRFENESIKQLKLTGTFEKESLQEVMEYLSATAGFSYKINKDEIMISKNNLH
jgi:transmembrane sensor